MTIATTEDLEKEMKRCALKSRVEKENIGKVACTRGPVEKCLRLLKVRVSVVDMPCPLVNGFGGGSTEAPCAFLYCSSVGCRFKIEKKNVRERTAVIGRFETNRATFRAEYTHECDELQKITIKGESEIERKTTKVKDRGARGTFESICAYVCMLSTAVLQRRALIAVASFFFFNEAGLAAHYYKR